MFPPHLGIAPLRPCHLLRATEYTKVRTSMLDLLVAVLGTGGILLMAAYAALCDRI